MWANAMEKICFWFMCILLVAGCLLGEAIVESLTSFDRSAMAWITFLPFIFPIFIAQAACYVLPVAFVCELIMWLKQPDPTRKTFRRKPPNVLDD